MRIGLSLCISLVLLNLTVLSAFGQDRRDKYEYEGELKLMDATHM